MTGDSLVGTWRLVSYEIRDEDSTTTRPFGPDPVGLLTYTADGFMTGQLGRANRARVSIDDWETAPDAEIAAAARDYFAYYGTYEYRGDTVIHRVEMCLMPNWIGGEQVRFVALDRNRLTLSAPFTANNGRHHTASLVWSRARNE